MGALIFKWTGFSSLQLPLLPLLTKRTFVWSFFIQQNPCPTLQHRKPNILLTWQQALLDFHTSLFIPIAFCFDKLQHPTTANILIQKQFSPPSPAIYRRRRTKQSVNPANKYTTHLRTRGINCTERSRGGLVHCIQEKRRFPKFLTCSFI